MNQPRKFEDEKMPISTRELIPSDGPVTPGHVKSFVAKRNKKIEAKKKVKQEMEKKPGRPPKE